MEEGYIIIAIVCLIGASYRAYQLGVREGADQCVEKLREMKIIAYDNKGNIVPNKWFDA